MRERRMIKRTEEKEYMLETNQQTNLEYICIYDRTTNQRANELYIYIYIAKIHVPKSDSYEAGYK